MELWPKRVTAAMNKYFGLQRHFCMTHNHKTIHEEQDRYAGQVSWRRRHLFVSQGLWYFGLCVSFFLSLYTSVYSIGNKRVLQTRYMTLFFQNRNVLSLSAVWKFFTTSFPLKMYFCIKDVCIYRRRNTHTHFNIWKTRSLQLSVNSWHVTSEAEMAATVRYCLVTCEAHSLVDMHRRFRGICCLYHPESLMLPCRYHITKYHFSQNENLHILRGLSWK